MKKYLFSVIGIVAVAGGVWWKSAQLAKPNSLDGFAQCLAEKGVTMYGADWCAHCQQEKKAFGSAFQYVPYVECPKNPQTCLDRGVEGYPTWIFEDGHRLVGEQGIEKLAQESGCELP
ncbi:hypothetical protein HYW17_05625 [Candidatus Uhrbacteria bacterium]|nr:hypothetical protein [Candidatus Uhrbacteria bacterium]